MHDVLADGRRFRVFTIVDDFIRECPALVVDTSISGVRVARELDRIIVLRGRPCMVVSDNGTELTSNAILKWSEAHAAWLEDHKAESNGRLADRLIGNALAAPISRAWKGDWQRRAA